IARSERKHGRRPRAVSRHALYALRPRTAVLDDELGELFVGDFRGDVSDPEVHGEGSGTLILERTEHRGHWTKVQWPAARLALAQLADRGELRRHGRNRGLGDGLLFVTLGAAAGLLGRLQRLRGLGLVQVVATDCGVGEHRDHVGLNLDDAAVDEDQLLVAAAGRDDTHRTRLDARDERRVARIDSELARLAGQDDELGFAGEDRLLGADHVDVDRGGHLLLGPAFIPCRRLLVAGFLQLFAFRDRLLDG